MIVFTIPQQSHFRGNGREFICSAGGTGYRVWVVDNVDEDFSYFIHGVATRWAKTGLDELIDELGEFFFWI